MIPYRKLASSAPRLYTISKQKSQSGCDQKRHYRSTDFSHIVVGGGVVGLAVARKLQERESSTPQGGQVLLIEKNSSFGSETSSRNSEVIHAGIYYEPSSLKSLLCRRGRDLIYDYCNKHGIEHRVCGKWIVAQDRAERGELEKIRARLEQAQRNRETLRLANPLGKLIEPADFPQTHFIGPEQAVQLEPAARVAAGALVSPSTGIVNSHMFMQQLEADLEAAGCATVLSSTVVSVTPSPTENGIPGSSGWAVSVLDEAGEKATVTAENLVNAAGHGAPGISNMVLPPERRTDGLFVKGSYFGYSSSGLRINRLIYPVPPRDKSGASAGLGTHLTIDLAGRVRFGPDIEWTDRADDLQVGAEATLELALEAIRTYLPAVDPSEVYPDYAGVRPKLSLESPILSPRRAHVKEEKEEARGSGPTAASRPRPFYADFYIAYEAGFAGFVNLMGIESPGLTSSLAVAELVDKLLLENGVD